MDEYHLPVNGFDIRATFSERTVDVLAPLLIKLTSMQRIKKRRLIVFLAAPPACGKSTLAAFIEMLSLRPGDIEPIQPAGIDGFHYHQDFILSHTVNRDGKEIPMKDVKGCPESYDVQKLRDAILALKDNDIRWPFYNRRLHDVVEDAIDVNRKIVLIEGNWLLLNEGVWSTLKDLCDISIMLRADESMLKSRLIERKIRGGLSAREAAQFYRYSDRPNILRCLNDSASADVTLQLDADGSITLPSDEA